jgi:hypothetical protein
MFILFHLLKTYIRNIFLLFFSPSHLSRNDDAKGAYTRYRLVFPPKVPKIPKCFAKLLEEYF